MKIAFIFITLVLLALPIAIADEETIRQGDDVRIEQTVTLGGAPSSSITCNITVRDPTNIVIVPSSIMVNNGITQQQEFIIFGPVNSTVLGTYTYPIFCTDGILNDTGEFTYEVNPSGKKYIPQISGPLLFGGIISLIFMSIFLLILGKSIEYFPIKVFLFILSGLFAIVNIGFVVGGMQEFLSINSALSSSFGGFYILFTILLVGGSIFLLFWLMITAFKLYQVKRGLRLED